MLFAAEIVAIINRCTGCMELGGIRKKYPAESKWLPKNILQYNNIHNKLKMAGLGWAMAEELED